MSVLKNENSQPPLLHDGHETHSSRQNVSRSDTYHSQGTLFKGKSAVTFPLFLLLGWLKVDPMDIVVGIFQSFRYGSAWARGGAEHNGRSLNPQHLEDAYQPR